MLSCLHFIHHPPSYFSGLLAKNAINAGLTVKPYIKTSMSPGSGVVTYYLKESGVADYMQKLGCVGREGRGDEGCRSKFMMP